MCNESLQVGTLVAHRAGVVAPRKNYERFGKWGKPFIKGLRSGFA